MLFFLLSLTVFAGDLQEFQKHGSKKAKWAPLVEAGFSAFDSGSTEAAASFFQQAIEKGCKDSLVYFDMGLYYESNNNMIEAEKYLKLAAAGLPGQYPSHEASKTIHEHLGRIFFSTGNLPGAKAEITKAIEKQGESFTLLFLLGSIARQENDYNGVVNYYTTALSLPPTPGTDPQAIVLTLLVEIGKAYYELKQYDNSIKTWDQILTYSPNHPIARKYKEVLTRKKMGSKLSDEEKRSIQKIIE